MKNTFFLKVVLKFLQASCFVLPNDLIPFYGNLIGGLAYRFDKKGREKVFKNLSIAFKNLDEKERIKIAKGFYKHITQNIMEFFKLSNEGEDLIKSVEVENKSILKDEFEKGKGVIVITAHLGNWELLAAKLVADGYPLTVIAKEQQDIYLNEILVRTRKKIGMTNIPKKEVSFKNILNILRKGEVVGLLADQNGGRSGIFVEFFGVPASTYKGPAYFAYRSDSPTIPMFCFRTKMNNYKIKILPPITINNKKDKNEFIFNFTKTYTSIIEEEIRNHPEQWLWLHDRWKTKPTLA